MLCLWAIHSYCPDLAYIPLNRLGLPPGGMGCCFMMRGNRTNDAMELNEEFEELGKSAACVLGVCG